MICSNKAIIAVDARDGKGIALEAPAAPRITFK